MHSTSEQSLGFAPVAKRQFEVRVRCALRLYGGKTAPPSSGQRGRQKKRCTPGGFGPAKHKRNSGGGRRPKAEELYEELWHWFVDQLATVKSRIGSRLLEDQAALLNNDMLDRWMALAEAGETDPDKVPKLPKINNKWVQRWRRRCGVSARTVNLRYKVSAEKRRERVRVFWCNAIRVRALHEALFGPGRLRFLGFDQKPMYFNSCHGKKNSCPPGVRSSSVQGERPAGTRAVHGHDHLSLLELGSGSGDGGVGRGTGFCWCGTGCCWCSGLRLFGCDRGGSRRRGIGRC